MTTTRKLALWLALAVIGTEVPSPGCASIVSAPPGAGGQPGRPGGADPVAPASDAPASEATALPTPAGLERALARYREIAAHGGWPRVPDGPSLSMGMSDPGIPALRRRLMVTGELAAQEEAPDTFDAALAKAVRAFQQRHGLAVDGVVGRRTRAALDVSVAQRIEQIERNIERLGSMPAELGERYVLVNIPAYSLEFVVDGVKHIDSPVVVGKNNWRTPTFSSEITNLVFNPTWYVPSSIARREMLPRDAAEPGYLDREGIVMTVRDTTVRLRQPPGPRNPLGKVKFYTPNAYGVYLHDTPNKRLMQTPVRAYSHGCVRIRDAVDLAFAIFREDPAWSESLEKRILSGWTTRHITLESPVPLHLIYLTAWEKDGVVHFREDVYRQDHRTVPTTTAAR